MMVEGLGTHKRGWFPTWLQQQFAESKHVCEEVGDAFLI